MDSLWSAATGMLGQQTAMDGIANNLANVNTSGYKRGRTAFEDLLYDQLTPQQAAAQGSQVGLGTRVAAIQTQFDQGPLQTTGNPLDLAIEGDGFFEVTRPDGTKGYTRDGTFTTDASGKMTDVNGDVLSPGIKIPSTAKDVSIAPDGSVTATVNGKTAKLGTILVATFPNVYGLSSAGGNTYNPTVASGGAIVGHAQSNGAGKIDQGMLEASNVNAVDEMVGMIATQRAYESVSKVISASDEMLGMANQLRHG